MFRIHSRALLSNLPCAWCGRAPKSAPFYDTVVLGHGFPGPPLSYCRRAALYRETHCRRLSQITLKVASRFLGLALEQFGDSPIQIGQRLGWLEGEGFVEIADCSAPIILRQTSAAAARIGDIRSRVEIQGPGVVRNSLVPFALFLPGHASADKSGIGIWGRYE